MKPEIRMEHGGIAKLAREVNHSRIHVANCLKGIVKTENAKKIRDKALEMGGVMVEH